ncbi:hypothetical protein C923_04236 [Plasmodium falciparum UGT5.1]|uniref:THUMP domain-containing protein n=10 Tax=Plasmodium falciparum TaxID=5833 RepID=W7J8Z1_PLAFA|nr:hypothetical protein C923_04236 [Plasmodium falciparum UGT5.1]
MEIIMKIKMEILMKIKMMRLPKQTAKMIIKKKNVLTVLDNCIGNNYSVNLTKPDLAIIVHVTEIMCGISIIRDYDKTRKFNISSFNEDSQKINVSAQCKGILLSTVSPRKMSSGIKEFINFLKLNFPEENLENGEIKIKEAATDDHDNDSDRKTSNVEKQLNEEIRKENSDYIRFAPLRNIIKNFTFIKFNNAADKNPSEIVTQIFSMARNKKEKYILRNICKIIPFDCICKPHISPFIKTLLPLLKENFSKGLCVQENFTITNLLKLLNVSEEKTTELANKQDEPQEENGNEDTSKSNENKNGDNIRKINMDENFNKLIKKLKKKEKNNIKYNKERNFIFHIIGNNEPFNERIFNFNNIMYANKKKNSRDIENYIDKYKLVYNNFENNINMYFNKYVEDIINSSIIQRSELQIPKRKMNKTNYTKNNIMGNLLNYEYVQYHNFYKRENEEKYFKPAKNNNDEE